MIAALVDRSGRELNGKRQPYRPLLVRTTVHLPRVSSIFPQPMAYRPFARFAAAGTDQ